ncbi:MBL fold metallo-hydrolase [Dysgonomonas sp. 521]|uniref:MBL fold metallo-hydrolase n=1 Tax=Dysgonomonas sp. 521 TaxID=2302932 RepID=UPI0013CF9A05|nr:MBL fold metallo-hydrolase [Dysgonomonas sp. 521]NDV94070.1 MBL fold metallo-hydrolase [Dysgonomonas sp. 521]
MKLTYIYHSGYAIEGDGFTIIVDYYKDSSDIPGEGIVHKELLKKEGKLYVLCTHSHHDHFNKEVLKWKWEHPNVVYIFSKDILKHKKAKDRDAIYLDKSDTYRDETLFIQAFGSTDLGVSFLIKTADKTIFHAGDLNNWHWNEESTKEEIDEAEAFYQDELNLLASKVKHLDLAMFPIDPRLGKDYMKGAEQFISAIQTDIFAPMHFAEAYEQAAAFAGYAESKNCKFIRWKHRGENIVF